MAAETVGAVQPLLYDISNAELAAAMSADILILNMYDVNEPVIKGLPEHKKPESIFVLKKLTGSLKNSRTALFPLAKAAHTKPAASDITAPANTLKSVNSTSSQNPLVQISFANA